MQYAATARAIPVTLLASRDAIVQGMSYSRSASPILLAVHDVRDEVRAGFGQSLFAVRTLDGVSLAVRAGELVVLRGGVACGAASLIAHLTGTRAIRSGARIVARGVQVRRGCISARALDALMAGWSAIPAQPIHATVRRVPVVHVFRVRPFAESPAQPGSQIHAQREQWRAWAMTLRAQGGSIVVHAPLPAAPKPAPLRRYGLHPLPRNRPVVSEAAAEGTDTPGEGVRVLTLAAGRIVSADEGPIDPLHSQ